jgi:hypothetical protein
LKPGHRGTKRLLAEYGDRLVCVRYRYDEEKQRKYKTVELIVEESAWQPRTKRLNNAAVVGVRVGVREVELQKKVRSAGGRWNPDEKFWELRYDKVAELGLLARLIKPNRFTHL